ncbi:hypothetical protein, partial [Providencia stuartii]|uniref:hypothetical protein n=1 Tax=Providencia stuartii TaxID=588 RepID=UPI0024AB3277
APRNKKKIQHYTTGSAYIDYDGVRVNIDDYFLPKLNLKLTPLTSKLLQLMIIEATQLLNRNAVTEIALSLNLAEVASDLNRNIESKQAKYKFKKEFFSALEVLSRINLRVEEELNGKSISIGKAHLLNSFMPSETEKDTTKVILGLEFLKYLSNGYLKSIDMSILKISDASSHQFHTAYNNYVTMGNNLIPIKNQKGPVRAKIFKVETAIRWTAKLPTIEDVKNGDRNYTLRILEPLEKILDDEHGLIQKWEWCKAKGEKLTSEELENIGSYDVLKKLNVKVITLKKEEELLEGALAAAGRIMESKEKKANQKARRVAKAKARQPKPDKDE